MTEKKPYRPGSLEITGEKGPHPSRPLGERARYWLSDEGWERFRAAEREREEHARRARGPKPVHVEPAEPPEELVRRMAGHVRRQDAVAFVRGWRLIFGDLEAVRYDSDYYVSGAHDHIEDLAMDLWFKTEEILSVIFGPGYTNTVRAGQLDACRSKIREEVGAWLRTVEETLP